MPNTKYGARLRKWMETNGKAGMTVDSKDSGDADGQRLTESTVETVNAVEPGLDTPPVSTERPGDGDAAATTETTTRAPARKSTAKRTTTARTTTKSTAKKTTPKKTTTKSRAKS